MVTMKKSLYVTVIKRLLDIVFSLLLLICTSPIMVAAAVLIRTKLGKPVLFRQKRAGMQGKQFAMFKFRSMTNETDENGNLLPDEDRLTSLGKRLRSTSIDELPGLFNVLRGEMSLIGPRPLPIEYLAYYDDFQMRRHEVKPGIVGLASIRGRNNQSWDSKFKNDIEYVDTVSFRTDMKIFFKAIAVVLKRTDVNADGYAAGEPFISKESKGKTK